MKKISPWISDLNRLFWERAVRSTYLDTKSLSVFRIITGLFLLTVHMPSFAWIADMPKTFFNPPIFSLAIFFDTFPDKTFFLVLDCLVLLSLIGLTVGLKARVSALVYLMACIVGLTFQYSFGKISHTILSYLMIGCLAFSGWGRYLALLPDKESRFDNTAKSLSLFSVLICFGMFTAGFEKALSWVDFDLAFNGFLSWSQNSIFRDYKYYLLAPYIKYFPVVLLELFDYTAVFFELSPLVFLLHSRRAWKVWLLIACVFHLTNAFLLNIPYPRHIVVYLAFVDFTWLYYKMQDYLRSFYFRCTAMSIVALIILIRVIQLVSNSRIRVDFFGQDETARLNLYSSIITWCIAAFLVAKNILQEASSGKRGGMK